MCFEGVPARPYISGDRFTWKVLAEYSWSPTTARSGSFLCSAASPMPIRVVTREVRYIHVLSLILEHSMPINCPATLGLTSYLSLIGRNNAMHQILNGSNGVTYEFKDRFSYKMEFLNH